MPSFKACLLCGWCDSRGSRVATGMGSDLRPYAHEWVCGCERKEGVRFLSFLLALKALPGHPGVLCMWLNTLGRWASPPFQMGWKAWKTWKQAPGFEPRGNRGSHVNRQEPYSPKEAAQSPEQIPLCQSMAAGWDVGLPPSQASTCRGTAAQRSTGHMVSQRSNRAANLTQCRPFPMHTYLERAVKLKWALLYVLRLMVSVIKLNSIYNMSCVEPRSKSLWPSPQLVFI